MPSPDRGRARKGIPLPRLTRREFLGALGAGAAALALPAALAAPASAQRRVVMAGQSNFVESSPRTVARWEPTRIPGTDIWVYSAGECDSDKPADWAEYERKLVALRARQRAAQEAIDPPRTLLIDVDDIPPQGPMHYSAADDLFARFDAAYDRELAADGNAKGPTRRSGWGRLRRTLRGATLPLS